MFRHGTTMVVPALRRKQSSHESSPWAPEVIQGVSYRQCIFLYRVLQLFWHKRHRVTLYPTFACYFTIPPPTKSESIRSFDLQRHGFWTISHDRSHLRYLMHCLTYLFRLLDSFCFPFRLRLSLMSTAAQALLPAKPIRNGTLADV